MITLENLRINLMYEPMHLMRKEIIGLLKMLDGVVLQLDQRQILINIYLLLMIFQINMMVNLMLEHIQIKIKKKIFGLLLQFQIFCIHMVVYNIK